MRSAAPPALAGKQRRWSVAPATDPSPLGALPPVVGHLLWRRGVRSAGEASDFLQTSDALFEDPGELPDIERAVERIESARRRGETVAVFGDFDADGVTGAALLVKALGRYGARTLRYLPHRVSEGHGLNRDAIAKLREQGASLIVTVDCGVTNVGEAAYAKSLGADVIITDHHLVGADLPDAVAVINPRAPHSRYGFEHLTGAGMALKLAQALLQPEFGVDWSEGLMELAAIGTVADMAPLIGENRYVVHHGLRELRGTRSAGLRALLGLGRGGGGPEQADARTVGFGIAPRVNAAGRLGRADAALDLLLTDDAARAYDLACELNACNERRRALTDETLERARALVPSSVPPLILAGEPDFHPGVVGLVAGKLAEEFGAPAAVYGVDGGVVTASCRSAPSFHWADALDQCGDLLLRSGGHAQAAGFRCGADALPELRERLESIAAERVGAASPALEGVADAEAQPGELMGRVFSALRRMEPFGVGNPAPLFLTRGMEVVQAAPVGAEGKHFRMSVRSGGALWGAVAFRQQWEFAPYVDAVYALEVDHWNGRQRLRLNIQDYAPSDQGRLES